MERRRRESHSSSSGSWSSSGKHHCSSSHSRDETNPKKGRQMPTEDQNCPASATVTPTSTLNWGQDILEPPGPTWKPARENTGYATTCHNFVVKSAPAQPPCGKGRGQILREKLKELPAMAPQLLPSILGMLKQRRSLPGSPAPSFPTKEELTDKKQLEE